MLRKCYQLRTIWWWWPWSVCIVCHCFVVTSSVLAVLLRVSWWPLFQPILPSTSVPVPNWIHFSRQAAATVGRCMDCEARPLRWQTELCWWCFGEKQENIATSAAVCLFTSVVALVFVYHRRRLAGNCAIAAALSSPFCCCFLHEERKGRWNHESNRSDLLMMIVERWASGVKPE